MVSKRLIETFYRLAAGGWVPRGFFAPELPSRGRDKALSAPPRPLRLEVVSHCWRYAAHLTYQLSSLVLHPPRETEVTMTVFYSPEDTATADLLSRFGRKTVQRVTWNWQPLEKTRLFRRCIGRNIAARATGADWIWFCDCDVIFHEGALDGAAKALRGRDEFLLFPPEHGVSDYFESDDPIFRAAASRGDGDGPILLDVDPSRFKPEIRDRAVGAFQIVRGDVARAAGYCGNIAFYQRPVARWQKTYEDRTFRWLLGTQGTPIEIPGLYRIRHITKGRKTG